MDIVTDQIIISLGAPNSDSDSWETDGDADVGAFQDVEEME
jgi:hypothetical protein